MSRIRLARLGPSCSPIPGRADPDEDPPGGLAAWDAIPGARGCTPQACAYRDRHGALVAAGARVFGLSTQDTAYQQEMAERLHLPFPVLSDESPRAGRRPAPADLRDRRPDPVQAAHHGHPRTARIEHVLYPVFPSDRDAEQVLRLARGPPCLIRGRR